MKKEEGIANNKEEPDENINFYDFIINDNREAEENEIMEKLYCLHDSGAETKGNKSSGSPKYSDNKNSKIKSEKNDNSNGSKIK